MRRAGIAIAAMMLAISGLATVSLAEQPIVAPDHELYPSSSIAWRRLAGAAIEKGDKADLSRAVTMLYLMGAALRFDTRAQLLPQMDAAIVNAVMSSDGTSVSNGIKLMTDNFEYAEIPSQHSEAFAELPAQYRLIEGIAADRKQKQFYFGSVVDGHLAYLQDGKFHDVALTGPVGGIFGMAIDPKGQQMWIAMAAVEQTAIEQPFEGLALFDLESRKIIRRVAVPDGVKAKPNDLAIGKNGSVFVSDSVGGALLHCDDPCSKLEILIEPGTFRSPQGIVALPDGKRLIVADYGRGLWMVDIAARKASIIKTRQPFMLDGIDGMIADTNSGALIAVQNGTNPRRIIRIELSSDSSRVEEVYTIEQNAASWIEPTLLTRLDDQSFVYVAEGQWEFYGPGGQLKDGKEAKSTGLRRAMFAKSRTVEIPLLKNGSQ